MDPEERDDIEARRKEIVELTSAVYEKGAAYTNLILVGGYAGFLTVWSNSKPLLSDSEARYSVLLILVSLLCFILWEIYKMFMTSSLQQ